MLAVAILPVQSASYVGPLQSLVSDREKYNLLLNETASVVDAVYGDKLDKVGPPAATLLNRIVIRLPTDIELVDQYAQMMEDHVTQRIAVFFEQLITCYQTKLHFEIGPTCDQAQSPDRVVISDNQTMKDFQRQAAHNSTIPCLIAYDEIPWQAWRAGLGQQPPGFVFLDETDSYRQWNATMNMHRIINDGDSWLDGKSNEPKLRQDALSLINVTSQGKLSPDQALEAFITAFLNRIELGLQNNPQGFGLGRYRVLQHYKQATLKILSNFKENRDRFLDALLDLDLKGKTPTLICRRALYMIRFRAIRDSQLGQSVILQKINTLRDKIIGELRAKQGRKPDYCDAAFRALIVSQARTDQDRKRLEKLYNFSQEDYAFRVASASGQTKFNKTITLLWNEYASEIQFVALQALHDMRSLRTQEEYQRAQVTREVRTALKLTQTKLGQLIKAKFPFAAASQPTISRIETRKKLVTPQIAEELSETFGVPAGLFMPHFFYE